MLRSPGQTDRRQYEHTKQADETHTSGTHQLQMELVAGASSSTALNLAIAFLITPGSVAERISCTPNARNGQLVLARENERQSAAAAIAPAPHSPR